jgi:hypothetical protein
MHLIVMSIVSFYFSPMMSRKAVQSYYDTLIVQYRDIETRERSILEIRKVGWPIYRTFKQEYDRNPKVKQIGQRLLDELYKDAVSHADVFVIGVDHSKKDRVQISVRRTGTPMFIALCGGSTIHWDIVVDNPNFSLILDVYVSGKEKQFCDYPGATIVTRDDRMKGADGKNFYFYAIKHDEKEYPDLAEKIQYLFSKDTFHFRGRSLYLSLPFEITDED